MPLRQTRSVRRLHCHAAKAGTFAYVVLEPMARGTAFIVTAVGGIPEQVVVGETDLLATHGGNAGCAGAGAN